MKRLKPLTSEWLFFIVLAIKTKKSTFFKVPLSFERTGDRTLDPQIKSLLLYRLSYPPDAK